MTTYSHELKEQIVRKMMPPNAQSVAAIHRESGISAPTFVDKHRGYLPDGSGAVDVRCDADRLFWRQQTCHRTIPGCLAVWSHEIELLCPQDGFHLGDN